MAEDVDMRDPGSRVHAPRQSRAKKDRKRWCRGKAGVEHRPQVVFRPPVTTNDSSWDCREAPEWMRAIRQWRDKEWCCRHREECSECGRVLRPTVPVDECPARA